MFFTKLEKLDNEDFYVYANKIKFGFSEKSNGIQLPPIERPSKFDKVPVEVIAKIASTLSHNDLANLRQASKGMNSVYIQFRNQLKGPEVHVFLNIENGTKIVTTYRGHRQWRGEARPLTIEKRNSVLRNSDVTLTLRFGENMITKDTTAEILKIFNKSNIQRVQLRAETVSQQTKDLINSLECMNVELNIGKFDEMVATVNNIKDLRIRQQLLFFQLITIFRLNIARINASVTAASLPLIVECINEWRASRREIHGWFFKVPLVDIVRDWNEAEIDWRRTITQRIDGTSRLLMNRRTEPLETGNLTSYQTVSWILA
ncbi:F-box domain-containing protein [Caenorhabditis elegans]|nr:F-box domain-containing protein [Caenorhabditis elegans]CCH63811.1 F-box domain-containing protein [Caenorhabditis elegans]|eukprot:NP_001256306.1 Uncharacterized protein CELE_C06H2.7 [Caenorhabditis elegans]